MPPLSVGCHCLCLAYNSLWLLVPTLFAVYDAMYTHALLTALTGVCSIVHWLFYRPFHLWFWLDVGCANVTIVYYLTNAPPNMLLNQLLCMGTASVFFLHACWHPVGSYRGLAAHLCFRYFCYCGMMVLYVHCTIVSFVFYSILYVSSVLCSVWLGNHG